MTDEEIFEQVAIGVSDLWRGMAYANCHDEYFDEHMESLEVLNPDWVGAGPGQDWVEVSRFAVREDIFLPQARTFLKRLLEVNGIGASKLLAIAGSEAKLDRLGSDLAHEAVGSGVSWADDNEPHNLQVPDVEVHIYLGDDGDLHTYWEMVGAND